MRTEDERMREGLILIFPGQTELKGNQGNEGGFRAPVFVGFCRLGVSGRAVSDMSSFGRRAQNRDEEID